MKPRTEKWVVRNWGYALKDKNYDSWMHLEDTLTVLQYCADDDEDRQELLFLSCVAMCHAELLPLTSALKGGQP